MSRTSSPELLALHGVRLLGMADSAAVARRFHLDLDVVDEQLLDDEALGWVRRHRFDTTAGWGLTDAGRVEDERRLAHELVEAGAVEVVTESHLAFVPLNSRFQDAVTRWQIRPVPGDPLAANDHGDARWDDRVVGDLDALVRRVRPVCDGLTAALSRFDGYAHRLEAAVGRAVRGEPGAVDRVRTDSVHAIWFELHEDLLSTLGLER